MFTVDVLGLWCFVMFDCFDLLGGVCVVSLGISLGFAWFVYRFDELPAWHLFAECFCDFTIVWSDILLY